eukprot:2672970-Pleurochrysis_carterae.AAC.1
MQRKGMPSSHCRRARLGNRVGGGGGWALGRRSQAEREGRWGAWWVGEAWGRLERIGEGWGRRFEVGEGWGRLRKAGEGWGRLAQAWESWRRLGKVRKVVKGWSLEPAEARMSIWTARCLEEGVNR